MNDQTQTLVRAVLKIGAGYAIAKGIANDSQVTEITSGVIALFAVIWGYLHRTPAAGAATPVKINFLSLAGTGLVMIPLFLGSLAGCGTNTYTKIAQADQVIITGVNDGVQQWVAYVNAGKATAKQIQTFKIAYTAYYDAQQVLRAVLEKLAAKDPTATAADIATANAAVQSTENTLLETLRTILNAVILKV
jgi:hypothetical protein